MALNCSADSISNTNQGCPLRIGTVEHFILAPSNPGVVAISDLQSESFINAKIIAALSSRWFVLKNVFASAPTDNAPIVASGDTRSIQTGVTIGTDVYDFEYSQCLDALKAALANGVTFYVLPVTTKGIYKSEQVVSLDGDKSNVRFLKARIDFNKKKAVAGGADEMISISITENSENYEMRAFVGADVENVVQNVSVNLVLTGIANAGSTATFTATGCNYTDGISDLTIGADGVHEFELNVGGSIVDNEISGGTDIPGAVTQSGNIYTFTRTAGTFATAEVILGKYNDPSVTSENYVSNIPQVTV